MKVLAATSSFPRYTGDYHGNFIYDLCRRLAKNGVNITILAPRSRSTTGSLAGLEVKHFPFMPSQGVETLPEQTLKHASPGELLQLPSYLGSAYLHMVGETADIVHAHFAIPMGFLAALSPRSAPLVVTCHGSDYTLPLAKPAYRPFVEYALRKADSVIAVPELIRDGENGYLFEPMDVEGLAEKMMKAADSLELGRRARATILERFNMNKNVARYVELYRELISNRGRA